MKAAHDALALSGIELARPRAEAVSDLSILYQLLKKWQRVQNLVSRETLADYWIRHVADSLQLAQYFPKEARLVCDLGSGGGFPALPLAIVLKERGVQFVLVESNSRKVAFLRAVSRELDLPVNVLDKRIDSLVSRETGQVDIFTARALAPLSKLYAFIHPHWTPTSRALFHKGREYVEECRESDAHWRCNMLKHTSVVDPQSVVLEITDLASKNS